MKTFGYAAMEAGSELNILPTVETFPFSKINDAINRLQQGKMHYRAVLSN